MLLALALLVALGASTEREYNALPEAAEDLWDADAVLEMVQQPVAAKTATKDREEAEDFELGRSLADGTSDERKIFHDVLDPRDDIDDSHDELVATTTKAPARDELLQDEAALWPISACCTWCNQGSWKKAKNQAACEARASANGATHYTWKPKSKNCRIDKNSKGCKKHGSGYGKGCDGNVHTKPGYAKKKRGTCKDKATKSKKVTKRATTKYGGIKTGQSCRYVHGSSMWCGTTSNKCSARGVIRFMKSGGRCQPFCNPANGGLKSYKSCRP